MARLVEQLTEAKIRALTKSGLHSDGRGLYLQVRPGGARSWIFRFTLGGRTRDKGLGSLIEVGLMEARARAAECRAIVSRGQDPIETERSPSPLRAAGLTFEESAERYMVEKLKRLKSEVHRGQWRTTIARFAYPLIGRKSVAEVDTQDILKVLRPIWETRCETASRLRGRIERILARATVEGHRSGPNPAAWRGHLQEALPSRSEVRPVRHHPAMDLADLPGFMRELGERSEVGAIALRFLVLTAARTSEVTGSRWPEVNWDDLTWTVPAERSKTGRDHVVPLSTQAIAALRTVERARGVSEAYIFPGNSDRGLSQMTLLALLQRRMKQNVTCHGFRSTFRDWAGDVAGVDRDLAEASLAHVVRDATERAYRRKTAVERRRVVMQSWADFCLPPVNVVDMTALTRGRLSGA